MCVVFYYAAQVFLKEEIVQRLKKSVGFHHNLVGFRKIQKPSPSAVPNAQLFFPNPDKKYRGPQVLIKSKSLQHIMANLCPCSLLCVPNHCVYCIYICLPTTLYVTKPFFFYTVCNKIYQNLWFWTIRSKFNFLKKGFSMKKLNGKLQGLWWKDINMQTLEEDYTDSEMC